MSEPSEIPPGPMTLDAFRRWAAAQPPGRFELEAGEVVAMAPERAAHVRAKLRAWATLRDAIASAGLDCEALGDGLAVAVDGRTSFAPDALVNGGPPIADDAIAAPQPVIVVEVTAPSNSRVDLDAKFLGYFQVASIMHYLIVHLRSRMVVHHARRPDGRIESAILGQGRIALDPPGIALEVAALLP